MALLLVAALAPPGPAQAGETLAGPVRARVLEVIDGDTIAVAARIWLGQEVDIHVRLAGVDTPEPRGKCAAEREAAAAARALVATLAGRGEVVLSDIQYDKYGGRVLARVASLDGIDIAQALVARGLARPYDGKRRAAWCG